MLAQPDLKKCIDTYKSEIFLTFMSAYGVYINHLLK